MPLLRVISPWPCLPFKMSWIRHCFWDSVYDNLKTTKHQIWGLEAASTPLPFRPGAVPQWLASWSPITSGPGFNPQYYHVTRKFHPGHKCHSPHYCDPCLSIRPHLCKSDVRRGFLGCTGAAHTWLTVILVKITWKFRRRSSQHPQNMSMILGINMYPSHNPMRSMWIRCNGIINH